MTGWISTRSDASTLRLAAFLFLSGLPVLAGCTQQDDGVLRASGTIEVTDVRLSAQVPGQILRLLAVEGDRVRRGDTLAVIDHDLLQLQLQQAESGRRMAQAQLDLLRRGARAEDIAQARAQQEQAGIERDQARREAERLRALYEAGSATQQQLEAAQTRLAVAEIRHAAAREGLQKVEHAVRPEEMQVAAARLQQAEAATLLLRRQIREASLVAPRDGIVTEQLAEAGELVTPGMPLFTLADMDAAYLRVYVPEDVLGRLRLGQAVEVYTDAAPDRALAGRLVYLSAEAEFTPKNVQTLEERVKLVYEVKVTVPNAEGLLHPGMYADAVLRLE